VEPVCGGIGTARFLFKDTPPHALTEAVRTVAFGDVAKLVTAAWLPVYTMECARAAVSFSVRRLRAGDLAVAAPGRVQECMLNDFLTAGAVALASALAATVLFTAPGFLLHSAFLRGMRSPETHDRVFLARTVVGSLIVHAVALPWTLALVGRLRAGSASSWEVATWSLVVLVVLPVLAGAAAAAAVRLRRPRWLATTFDFMGLAPQVTTPDAWQWHFGQRRPHFVRVHLKDRRVVLGYLGSRSFSSSDPSRRDLYLERQYTPAEGKVYGPAVPASEGVWISGDEITYIEFHSGEKRAPRSKESEDE
jgi:hypothetical protein